MNKMNISRIDLNLLVIFDTLAQTRSVTAAANRLSLSQPAVSHALARLRDAIGDPLFVRSRSGLIPTPRAQAMIEPVNKLLTDAGGIFFARPFDPSTSTRRFRIGVSDYSMATVAPQAAARLATASPRARFEFVSAGQGALTSLEQGEMDCGFWGAEPPGHPFSTQTLFREKLTGVLRRNHPFANRAKGGRLKLEDYLDCAHAVVSLGGAYNPVDTALARLGRQRNIILRLPSFAGSLAVLAATDLVMSLPARLAAQIDPGTFIQFKLPLALPDYAYSLIWHRRTDKDIANIWLRDTIAQAAKSPVTANMVAKRRTKK